jgi:nicotinate phosphoribosyltransferase
MPYRKVLPPSVEEGYFAYLSNINMKKVKIYSVHEGSIVFPRIPIMRLEGPLGAIQLLETSILNLCNYASLITTNATRFRSAAGPGKTLLEFGLRRAQGPDGAMSASRYSFMGGFDGTSNVLAGCLYNIPVSGTHAHSFVVSYNSLSELSSRYLDDIDVVEEIMQLRRENNWLHTNEGELAAFLGYAMAFPKNFLALIDTYDTLRSGILNFCAVAIVLFRLGYYPLGVRLDSGDLAYLSKECRRIMKDVGVKYGFDLGACKIVASNDINEDVLHSLNDQSHEIDSFGIGTNLVTCQSQPALGMVFKLVEINGKPRIKLSNDIEKITLPGAKEVYRLIGVEGVPLLDLVIRVGESPPMTGKRIMCRHPFDEKKRAYVTPQDVIPLHYLFWDGENGGVQVKLPTLEELKFFVNSQLTLMREDHLRTLNATPYKVSVSTELYTFLHDLWSREVPIVELK